jgi:hypothetical protein
MRRSRSEEKESEKNETSFSDNKRAKPFNTPEVTRVERKSKYCEGIILNRIIINLERKVV